MNSVVMSGGCVFSSSIICLINTEAQSHNKQYFNYACMSTITSLRKENDALKLQVNSLQNCEIRLKNKNKHRSKTKLVQRTTRVQITEFQHIYSIEFLSAKYDTLSTN